MPSSTAPLRSDSPRWSRVYGTAAAAAVVVFLGTAVVAPLTMPKATADTGEAAMIARHQYQEHFTTLASDEDSVVDTSVTIVAEEPPKPEPKAAEKDDKSGEEAGSSDDEANDDSAQEGTEKTATEALYTLEEFQFSGVVNWGGYKFTFYSQQVLPGPGLVIPGRHVNAGGYVSDSDGYIVLAGDAPKGTVYDTPFGHQGKIYDRGTFGNHLDVYVR
ncbi:MAG: hypothetical protein ACK5LO_07150 [Leucobacter sp.]